MIIQMEYNLLIEEQINFYISTLFNRGKNLPISEEN